MLSADNIDAFKEDESGNQTPLIIEKDAWKCNSGLI